MKTIPRYTWIPEKTSAGDVLYWKYGNRAQEAYVAVVTRTADGWAVKDPARNSAGVMRTLAVCAALEQATAFVEDEA